MCLLKALRMHIRFCRTSTTVDKCDLFTPKVTNGYVIVLIAYWLYTVIYTRKKSKTIRVPAKP